MQLTLVNAQNIVHKQYNRSSHQNTSYKTNADS